MWDFMVTELGADSEAKANRPHGINVSIHGIDKATVRGSPTLPCIASCLWGHYSSALAPFLLLIATLLSVLLDRLHNRPPTHVRQCVPKPVSLHTTSLTMQDRHE